MKQLKLKRSREEGESRRLAIVDSRKDFIKGALCLSLGVEDRLRILVLVFVNWNLYKKKNFFGFSSQSVKGSGPR